MSIAVQVLKAGLRLYLQSQDNPIPSAAPNTRIHRAEMEAANQKLKESEERYRLVLEGSNDGIWDWYCATDEVYCNDRLLEIIGCSATTLVTPLLHRTDASGRLYRKSSSDPRSPDSWRKCVAEFRIRHSLGNTATALPEAKFDARDAFADVRYTQRPEEKTSVQMHKSSN